MGADRHREYCRVTDARRGQSRAAVAATLAMSCVLAACGVEPRVDEVRVSITAPTLAKHRQLGASTVPSPHDADPDSADVTTPHDAHRPVAIDTATIAVGDEVVNAEHGGAVVALSDEAQLLPRPYDPADARPPAMSAGSDDLAATGAGLIMADDARGDGALIDSAPSPDSSRAHTAGLASSGVESSTATASGGGWSIHL